MMQLDSAQAVKQCLADVGCDPKTIAEFSNCMEASDLRGGLAVLAVQRAQLLDRIHRAQFCIAMLDDLLRGC